jgi:hypothetical protein
MCQPVVVQQAVMNKQQHTQKLNEVASNTRASYAMKAQYGVQAAAPPATPGCQGGCKHVRAVLLCDL